MKGNFNEIIKEAMPVVVDFHATWCGPCKAQAPILSELASEMSDQIKVIKIDVDHNGELAGRYGIRSVPTLMVFKNGEIKYQQAGVHSKSQLKGILAPMLS